MSFENYSAFCIDNQIKPGHYTSLFKFLKAIGEIK